MLPRVDWTELLGGSCNRLLDSVLPPARAKSPARLPQRYEVMAAKQLPGFAFNLRLASLEDLTVWVVLEDRRDQAGKRLRLEDSDLEPPIGLLTPARLSSATVRRRVDCPNAAGRRVRDVSARILLEGDEDSHGAI